MISMKESEEQRKRRENRFWREAWGAEGRARVVHPRYGEIIVPASSRFSALLCAASAWGIGWTAIRDAEVWSVSL